MKPLLAAVVAAVIASAGQTASAQQQTTPPQAPSDKRVETPSEKEAQAALEKAGYTMVKDVKSTRDGVAAKATKDGKEVSVVVDSEGKIQELPK